MCSGGFLSASAIAGFRACAAAEVGDLGALGRGTSFRGCHLAILALEGVVYGSPKRLGSSPGVELVASSLWD